MLILNGILFIPPSKVETCFRPLFVKGTKRNSPISGKLRGFVFRNSDQCLFLGVFVCE
jgi:hypothetical protein